MQLESPHAVRDSPLLESPLLNGQVPTKHLVI